MSESLVINSHMGPYTVLFDENALSHLDCDGPSIYHFVVDELVAKLYENDLKDVMSSRSVLFIKASEESKSLDKFPSYVEHLMSCGVRRDHILVAIGGGITQDITCFLAATLLRGVRWHFYPTTLLAQADSCIGSKSSINVGYTKNILGTFTPPEEVRISTRFLKTLEKREVLSGIGEMLKVHAIDGCESFDRIATDYERILVDYSLMEAYIIRSLVIKKRFVELDEFDKGPRNIMNYGHSFGHAIESATDFAIPHGIAVAVGMDMANYVAVRYNMTDGNHYQRMHQVLKENYSGFGDIEISVDVLLSAISKDKKNVGEKMRLIVPDHNGTIVARLFQNDSTFRDVCTSYLNNERLI